MEVIRASWLLSTLKKKVCLFIVVLSLQKQTKRLNHEFGILTDRSEVGKTSQG
jgi:hypothetical protein